MKRWPIVRHVRWLYLSWAVYRHARMWGSMGIGMGWPNEADIRMLDLIWRGEEA